MKYFSLAIAFIFISCSHKSQENYRGDTSFKPIASKPAFNKTPPTVCFDQGHNNLAVKKGFYKPILGLLKSDGYKVIKIKGAFTEEILKTCNTVYTSAVLGDPDMEKKERASRSAFSEDEIKSFTKWVKNGGSMLIMTDHKPMSHAASKLIENFGVTGSLTNVRNESHPVAPFPEPGIFVIENERMNHSSPILRGRNKSERVKKVYVFYGQALKGPAKADNFLLAGKEAQIGGLYDEPIILAETFPAMAIALKVGMGRVVVFGDATVFTSKMDLKLKEPTGMNRPGSDNVQMALNVFHWLSGVLN